MLREERHSSLKCSTSQGHNRVSFFHQLSIAKIPYLWAVFHFYLCSPWCYLVWAELLKCKLSQSLWVHMCSCPVVCRRQLPLCHLLPLIHTPLLPFLLQWSLSLGRSRYGYMFHLGRNIPWSHSLCMLTNVNHHILQMEASLIKDESCINLWYNKSLRVGLINIH